jgi:hypothetical protein
VIALAGLVALLALVSAIGGLYASLSQTQFGEATAAAAA